MKRIVPVGSINIGDGRITIQSMTNIPVEKIDETLHQIDKLQQAGCDIVRIAVPTMAAVKAFEQVKKKVNIPLVADIHFDYRLAIAAIEAGADKIRINPGNVTKSQLDKVIDCAKKHNVSIRIGVNSGSVNAEELALASGNRSVALINSLKDYVKYFESKQFYNIVLSVKSSDVRETVELNRMAAQLGYPLHLGVTEAGLPQQGMIKNAIGIGSLLLDGIGDTIRVSLTGDPVEEVQCAKDILQSLGLREGVTFVSCPKCGRCSIDLENVAKEVYNYVKHIAKPLKIAVMGCEVNGPGECKEADLGIAGANGQFVFFKKGVLYKRVDAACGIEEFKKEIDLLL